MVAIDFTQDFRSSLHLGQSVPTFAEIKKFTRILPFVRFIPVVAGTGWANDVSKTREVGVMDVGLWRRVGEERTVVFWFVTDAANVLKVDLREQKGLYFLLRIVQMDRPAIIHGVVSRQRRKGRR